MAVIVGPPRLVSRSMHDHKPLKLHHKARARHGVRPVPVAVLRPRWLRPCRIFMHIFNTLGLARWLHEPEEAVTGVRVMETKHALDFLVVRGTARLIDRVSGSDLRSFGRDTRCRTTR